MLVLSGIGVIILGFALRLNPLMVVVAAAAVTGWAAGLDALATLAALGKAFNANRFMAVSWLVFPLIGLLERGGLRQRARQLVEKVAAATAGRVLMAYFVVRQGTAMLGLTSLGGHVQMVRPLVAPMTEAAAERGGPIDDATRQSLRAHAAAVDNIAVFFGEDVFIAIGSILLIIGFMSSYGYTLTPFSIAVWAIPTAIVALVVHMSRLWLLDRRLKRMALAREAA